MPVAARDHALHEVGLDHAPAEAAGGSGRTDEDGVVELVEVPLAPRNAVDAREAFLEPTDESAPADVGDVCGGDAGDPDQAAGPEAEQLGALARRRVPEGRVLERRLEEMLEGVGQARRPNDSPIVPSTASGPSPRASAAGARPRGARGEADVRVLRLAGHRVGRLVVGNWPRSSSRASATGLPKNTGTPCGMRRRPWPAAR